jgi:hypothetical protein
MAAVDETWQAARLFPITGIGGLTSKSVADARPSWP